MCFSKRDVEINKQHDIRSKLKIGIGLSQREESYYLLFMATLSERYKYIKNKKKGVTGATARTNY